MIGKSLIWRPICIGASVPSGERAMFNTDGFGYVVTVWYATPNTYRVVRTGAGASRDMDALEFQCWLIEKGLG